MTARKRKDEVTITEPDIEDYAHGGSPREYEEGQPRVGKCVNCLNGNHSDCDATAIDHDAPYPYRVLCKDHCPQAEYWRNLALNYAEANAVAFKMGEDHQFMGRYTESSAMTAVDEEGAKE